MFDATPSRADLIRTAFPQVRAYLRLAEDAGFEPARAVNPTRFPSERHRPLGESSARKVTGIGKRGRTAHQWGARE
jgi:hypothetical protein